MSFLVKIHASLVPLLGIFTNLQIDTWRFSLFGTVPIYIMTNPSVFSTLLEKIAVTGRAHCQRQVAFFVISFNCMDQFQPMASYPKCGMFMYTTTLTKSLT